MRILADTDLLVFLYTLGRILVVSPFHLALDKRKRAVPKTLEFEEIVPYLLSEDEGKYLEVYDRKFAELNYYPTTTYRTTNFGNNLIRSYVSALEPVVRAVVMIVEVTANVNGTTSGSHSCTMEFITRFTDDTVLTTRNMQLKTLFDEAPFRVMQECPQVTSPGPLRRRHLVKLEKLNRTPVSQSCDFASIVKDVQRAHERFLAFQVERGAYRLNPVTDRYETTSKIHWRGIRNHFNPFLHLQRLPRWQFAMAALLGVALPVLAALIVAPEATKHAKDVGLPGALASVLVMLSAYVLAGSAVGYFVRTSNFLWSFIFTYLAVGSILGFHINPLPYSTVAGSIAHVVAQAAKRRRLILQGSTPSVPPVGFASR